MNEHVGFQILTVCTGNLVRSVIAEQLLRARLRPLGSGVLVRSAGTGASAGDGMPGEAVALSLRYGGDPEGHRARPLTREMVDGADLILTATREHRGKVVSLLPRASRVTFTLNQFARLIDSVDPAAPIAGDSTTEILTELVAVAAGQRGYLPPLEDPDDDDIADPYRQSSEVYERAGISLAAAVDTISSRLLLAAPRAETLASGI